MIFTTVYETLKLSLLYEVSLKIILIDAATERCDFLSVRYGL